MSCQCPKIHWQVREDLWCNILKQYYVMLRTGFFEVIFEHITPLSFLQNSIHYEEVTHKLSKNIFRKWSNGAWHRIKNKLLAGKQKPGTADLKILNKKGHQLVQVLNNPKWIDT